MGPRTGLGTSKNKTVSHLSGASKYDFPATQPFARSLPNTLSLFINTDGRFMSKFEIHMASHFIHLKTKTKTKITQQQQQQTQ